MSSRSPRAVLSHREPPRTSRECVSESFWAALGALRSQVKTPAKSLGLTLPQVRLLPVLADKGSSTPTVLACPMDLNLPATTRALEHLEDKELLLRARASDDRRRVLVTLSPKGQRTLVELERRHRAHHDQVNRLFSSAQRRRPTRDLRRIATALGGGNRWATGQSTLCQSQQRRE
jgi:DNA-binding MarR family transcriptional regulator